MGQADVGSGRGRPGQPLTLTCEPWASAPSREVLALLRQEYTRWFVELGWDLARDWAAVEPARQRGQLPGWLARAGDGRVVGWAFGVEQTGLRQIGALCAEDVDVARRLIDECLDGAGRADATLAFVRAGDAVTPAVWRARGFDVQTHSYLVAPAPMERRERVDRPDVTCGLEPFASGDQSAVAALLQAAYAPDRGLRPFARLGTPAEWSDYVEALTMRPGCGVFSPDASVVMRDDGAMIGAAIVTSIGPTTAHLAQLAVHPSRRGRGLSRTLVAAARANAARALGASRLSLIVSDANDLACALYARAGFLPRGRFIAAFRA